MYRQAQEDKDLLEHSLQIASSEIKDRLQKDIELNIQLAQANKMASLGTLASGVAHELNNPLAGIRGYAETLLESPHLTKECVTKLDRIIALSDRMASIVSHLLKISRKTDAQALSRVDFSTLLSEIIDFYQTKFNTENITISTNIPKNIFISTDFQRFTSIIQNLLNNSIDEFARNKFPEGHQHKILIQLIPSETSDKTETIQFTDNAGGIPQSIIDKIFDPFFSTKEVGKGIGLGLSLSRQIARDLGGDLTCHSENNESTFLITALKSAASENLEILSLKDATPQFSFKRTPGAKFKLVLVDDEPDILNVLTHHLKDFFDVTCFSDPSLVIDYLKENPCEILMTDLKMPKVTGDQLMYSARQINPDMGLVLMSGHVMISTDPLKMDFDQFVSINKPLPKKSILIPLIQSSISISNKQKKIA